MSTSLPDELRLAPHAPSPGWHTLQLRLLSLLIISLCSANLQRNKLSTDGVQYKALDGVFANLRWDLAVNQYTFYWDLLNHKSEESSQWQAISTFARGIAGGNGISRAAYIYDNVNLPEVQQSSWTVCSCLQTILKV